MLHHHSEFDNELSRPISQWQIETLNEVTILLAEQNMILTELLSKKKQS